MAQFIFEDDNRTEYYIDWATPGLTVVMDALPLLTQIVPASALGLFNAGVLEGHDTSFQVAALQAGGQPFPLGAPPNVVPINFYGKLLPTDIGHTAFDKTLANNPTDVLVPDPTGNNGLIDVFVRAADTVAIIVGTTIFLYVDVINNMGNPVNISKWTLTITN